MSTSNRGGAPRKPDRRPEAPAPQADVPGKDQSAAQDTQPPATGADRGSPTAPVMKQFAKTQAESGGRS